MVVGPKIDGIELNGVKRWTEEAAQLNPNPHAMSFRSTLLASEVPLDDAIHYSVYHPTEQTRRIIQSANGDKPLRESWLHSTSEDDALFVFRIGVPREEESEQLELDVAPTEQRTFSPGEIYRSKEPSLKVIWNQFVSAVTSRLVDDIVRSAPTTSSSSSSSVSVYRMKGHGFVMGHKTLSNEWTVGWEYRAKSRWAVISRPNFLHLHSFALW